jgi:hypothetical protein
MNPNLQSVLQILQRYLFPVVRILVLAYIGLAIALYLGQSNLVYMPSQELIDTPATIGLKGSNLKRDKSRSVQNENKMKRKPLE